MTPVRVRLLRTTAAPRHPFGVSSEGNCRRTSLIVSVSTLTEAAGIVDGNKLAVLDMQITETHAKLIPVEQAYLFDEARVTRRLYECLVSYIIHTASPTCL